MTTEEKKLFKTITKGGKTHKVNKVGFWVCPNCFGVDKHKKDCPTSPPETGREWDWDKEIQSLKDCKLGTLCSMHRTHDVTEYVDFVIRSEITKAVEARTEEIRRAAEKRMVYLQKRISEIPVREQLECHYNANIAECSFFLKYLTTLTKEEK